MQLELEVKMAQKGNKDAFIRLIQNSKESMYRVARSILKSDIECADAIQEAYLKAYKHIRSLKEPCYFKTWLIRILINECKILIKARSKTFVTSEPVRHDIQSADDYKHIEIQEIVNSLEDDLRIIVTLFYFEDLNVHEIAKLLEIPEGTIKSRLHRARVKLMEKLRN